jgi:hypothetical protein
MRATRNAGAAVDRSSDGRRRAQLRGRACGERFDAAMGERCGQKRRLRNGACASRAASRRGAHFTARAARGREIGGGGGRTGG